MLFARSLGFARRLRLVRRSYGLNDFNILDRQLVAGNQVGVQATTVGTGLAIGGCLKGFLTVLAIGFPFYDHHVQLTVLHVLGFFDGPLVAVPEVFRNNGGDFSDLQGYPHDLLHVVSFGGCFHHVNEVHDQT